MKALIFLMLGVFVICISGCGSVKNEGNVAASSTTPQNAEEEVVVGELPIVKRQTRPLRPIGKRTAWTLDAIDLVGGEAFSDTTKGNLLLEYMSKYEKYSAP